MDKQSTYVCYTFPGGKEKVLTMSYDDGVEADKRLVELFDKYGIKGTFHINTGLFGQGKRMPKDDIVSLYRNHEIACHTKNHYQLTRCPKEMVISEILDDREVLEQMVGQPVRGFSYPFGSNDDNVKNILDITGIVYGRTTINTGSFVMPEDYLAWNPTCHHNDNLLKLGQEFLDIHRKNNLKLMYVWGHSYEFDDDDNWSLIEKFCEMMHGKDDIWYTTNIEIYDYMQAVKQLRYTVNGNIVQNMSSVDVWLRLNDKLVVVEAGKIKQLYD